MAAGFNVEACVNYAQDKKIDPQRPPRRKREEKEELKKEKKDKPEKEIKPHNTVDRVVKVKIGIDKNAEVQEYIFTQKDGVYSGKYGTVALRMKN